ncbi:TrmH family RNA methyltransferase [Aliiglaciecola sp. M165]|uniref:TrmH family RNA methyltransferase n=1 Tax=Aliiglaciecola sp. M165 TaxID=2593649 RepID=UPI00117CD0A1|nr:RNA methyltransferase [Aliiglaciecola sp. M165]TRY31364.1 RNA methyltransferase [Aliiglaciecola sp. M165]
MKFEEVKKLNQKKYRSQFGYYLIEGEHLVLELQKAAANQRQINNISLYVTSDYQQWASQLTMDCTVSVISNKQMSQLSNTKTPQGIVACVPLPALQSQKPVNKQNERCIYLHEVQDPGNLGTIIRTLAWFGDFRLLLSANSVDPFNPKVVRSSMGAIFHVPIELDVALDDLHTRFSKFAYLDMHGAKISSEDFAHYPCYLFGNEARGVPAEALARFNADAYTIEGSGKIDSLNLASAVNICVYQLSKG